MATTVRQSLAASTGPWRWLPSLYFAEGLPYVIVMTVSVVMYKRLGLSNTEIALYTSWLYLPWVIKPAWSPLVELVRTKRSWIIAMQLCVGAGLAGVALTIPSGDFLRYTLAFLWLLAFSSATHDIAADGFYMLGLSQHDQAWFIGVRNTFYRLAMISGQGLLVVVAGLLETRLERVPLAWSITFLLAAGLFVILAAYHSRSLPRPAEDLPREQESAREFYRQFLATFAAFFRKKQIGIIVAFLLLFRLAEAQLVKMVAPFLLDPSDVGGLGLSTGDVGIVYGMVGVAMLIVGGLLGGFLAAKHGLKHWLWWMVIAINLPNVAYVLLAFALPESLLAICVAVGIEQFGYGFGFAAYTLYMIYVSDGPYRTSHFAICTGFMALGMMIPGMWSGWLQETVGYQLFFVWVLLATIPSFIVTRFIPLGADFGKKRNEPSA